MTVNQSAGDLIGGRFNIVLNRSHKTIIPHDICSNVHISLIFDCGRDELSKFGRRYRPRPDDSVAKEGARLDAAQPLVKPGLLGNRLGAGKNHRRRFGCFLVVTDEALDLFGFVVAEIVGPAITNRLVHELDIDDERALGP